MSRHQFKSYQNVVIHYTGENKKAFIRAVSSSIADVIFCFYENNILKKMIYFNYFYFSELEKKEILENSIQLLVSNKNDCVHRKNVILQAVTNFLSENKSILLDGFVHFRLAKYMQILDETIDLAVDKFLIEREYNEFISLLKLYVNSKENTASIVHLIYSKNESVLLDEHKNLINTGENVFKAKYLSDITFSSNDYALNTLLNIIPEKIYIHLIDSAEDEFIHTLKLVFENRIFICKDCPICNIYQLSDKKLHQLTFKD